MGVETEIKLATTPAKLERLLADPRLSPTDGTEVCEHLVSIYFDTADSRLHAAGVALRIREKARAGGTHREQPLKLPARHQAAIRRQEWNVPCPAAPPAAVGASPPPDPSLWPALPRRALAALLGDAPLQALGATHVTRIRRRIAHAGAIIDIMADSGEIVAQAHPRQPICELELELVEGTMADALSLAASLPLGPDLIWLVAGKGARCRAMAHGEPLRATPAPTLSLSGKMDVATAFRAIGWSCLNHLLANYPLVLGTRPGTNGGCDETDDATATNADAVHQSRVAIRRLRAAFTLFGASVADAPGAALRDGFKVAAAALSPARDAHVLLERVASGGLQAESPDSPALLAHLAAARHAATQAAQAHLASAEFQRLLVDFALWLERGDWRAAATAALGEVLPGLLKRRQRKLRRLARDVDLNHDEQLHTLRIETKKLRYALDFVTSALPTAAARAHARQQERTLGKLQDVLGDLHDIAIAARPPAAESGAGLSPQDHIALQQALAVHTGALSAQTPQLLRRAEKLLARNAKIPHWWAD